MKAAIFTLFSLLLCPTSHALDTWEICMDQGDFSLVADTFLKSYRASKSGCTMTFVELTQKSSKFSVNLCDANINIARFEALDSDKSTKHYAGSSGCPAPLFGADFAVTEKGGAEFTQAKARIWEIMAAVKKVYGPGTVAQDAVNRVKAPLQAEGKFACAMYLLEDYLNNCRAFEASAAQAAPAPVKEEPPIPGIHPKVIKK